MGKVVTKDKNLGYKEAMAEIAKVRKDPHVAVGIQGTSALQVHPESDKLAPVRLVDVATFNEFGTVRAPERSFIRSTMDEERRSLIRLTRDLFFKMGKGKMTTKTALTILGFQIQKLIKKKITDIKSPPNAPSTIEAKKRKSGKKKIRVINSIETGNPLIDTGLMRNSISFDVRMSGEIKDSSEVSK